MMMMVVVMTMMMISLWEGQLSAAPQAATVSNGTVLAGDWTHDEDGGGDDDDDFTVGGPAVSFSAGCHSQQRYSVSWRLDT